MNKVLLLLAFTLCSCSFDNIGVEGRIKFEGILSSIVGIDLSFKAGAFKYPEGAVNENEANMDTDNASSIWGYL